MTLFDVINAISRELKEKPILNAMWLEGSWATGKNNEHSDIDVWLDVEDNSFDQAIAIFRLELEKVGEIDWEDSRGIYSHNPTLQKHTFHLKGFPDEQRIELDLQQHSRNFIFDEKEHVIKVLFDKNQTIQWK